MYTVGKILHAGSRGALCRATRSADGASVLLRLVPEQYRPQHVERLRRDFRISGQTGLACVARPLALDMCEGRPALVLEDHGDDPLECLLEAPLPVPEFFRIALAVTEAMAEIHRSGFMHKGMDTGNILIAATADSCRVRIADFGSAEPIIETQVPAGAAMEAAGPYMAPEQTGRMQHASNARSDLYSLGVIFYRMLAGKLPFEARDPLEWAYCHIARVPVPPVEVMPALPAVLSALIMKLLAKEPDDRYQSADGLLHDLRLCRQRWQSAGAIHSFELAACDITEHFQLPKKLYGRENEVASLRDAFDRMVASGRPELVLVAGYSGIGKSSLVNELYKPIIRERGLFAVGKFDQYKRDISYATIVQAFSGLVQELLAESEESIARWKLALLQALGVNGQLLVDVIPHIEPIIGPQPPLPELPPTESRNRFRMVFRRFVGVFARKNHPLVLFLDDLQWADAASLDLLENLLTHHAVGYFLPVCAYRDNEVGAAHPLHLMLDALRRQNAPVSKVVLGPLPEASLVELTAQALRRSRDEALPLAQLLKEKTGGNPFFALQFLGALHDEQLIRFDRDAGGWRWEIEHIRARGFTDNVAEFMVEKFKRFSADSQYALQRLACLGISARVSLLALALACSEDDVHELLAEASRAGLVFLADGRYRFLHDRMQEAAYSLVPAAERPAIHLQIGRALAAQLTPDELENQVFDVASQLNQGVELIASVAERETLRRFNRSAGVKAKAAIAYEAARNYFDRAAALLPEDTWRSHYGETFSVYLELAECEYLTGNATRAELLFGLILQHVVSNLDSARVFTLRVGLLQTSGRFDDGVVAGLEALAQFGIALPETDDDIGPAEKDEWDRINAAIGARTPAELFDAPVATDAAAIAIIGLLVDLLPCAFIARNRLYPLLMFKAINLSLHHGNTGKSCVAYSAYAVVLASLYSDNHAGYAFSDMALRLNEKFNDVRLRGRLLFLHGNYLNFWHKPFSENVPLMEEAFRVCLEVGDLVWAGYASYRTTWQLLERGDSLDDVLAASRTYAAFACQSHNDSAFRCMRLEQQFIACLKGTTNGPDSFSDEAFDENECIAVFDKSRFRSGIAFYRVMQQAAAFIYRRYGDALDAARQAEAMHDVMTLMPIDASCSFFHALTLAALYTQVDTEQRREYLHLLKKLSGKLEQWARNCAENFLGRYALVSAEVARIEGRDLDAMQGYEQAIRTSAAQGLVHDEALANELAAYFYRTRGSGRTADAYLRDAHVCYRRWGASGKVAQLEAFYPQLQARVDAGSEDALPSGTLQLDALAVIKASQALSGEIDFDRLLGKLLRVVMEQAGAQKGYVILLHEDGLAIEAEALLDVLDDKGAIEVRRVHRTLAGAGAWLPVAVVNYVWRTRQKVLLENAAADVRFSPDAYIAEHQTKSVLCQPVFKQAELTGLLYLENNLVSGAFSADALGVLELLASQAAISLENARLYTDLEEENAERRRIERELQLSEAHYRRLFETAKDGILLLDSDSGIVRDVNSHLLDMLGYRREDLVGRRLWDVGPFGDIAVYRSVFGELQTNDSVRHASLRLHASDGQGIDVELVSSAYRVDQTRVVQCNIRDITDRRRAEQRQAVQFAVTRALADAATFKEAAAQLLQVICEKFGWEIGELWLIDLEDDTMCLLEWWETPAIAPSRFVEVARKSAVSPRGGLPGRLVETGQALWLPDVTADPAFRRPREAEMIGLHGSFAFPIFVNGGITHMMAFYSRLTRRPDEEMIDMMLIVGSQMGQFIERKHTEQALIKSEQRFRSLTGLSSDWYWEQDKDFRFTVMSEGVGRVGGMIPEHLIGKTRRELPIDLDSIDKDAWEGHSEVLRSHQPFFNFEYRILGEDGRWYWYSVSGEPQFDENGVFKGYRGVGKEISERKQAEALNVGQAKVLEMIAAGAALSDVLASLVLVMESQSEGLHGAVLLLDSDGRHVHVGAAPSLPDAYLAALEGESIGPAAGSCGTAMYRRERVVATDIAHDPLWTGYREAALQYGLRACWSTPILSQQGVVLGTFGMYYREVREPQPDELRLADIAARIAGIAIERKQAEERISYMAHHDALTGLPNRVLLHDRLTQAIAQAQRMDKTVGVMFIDLDDFKHINDSLGHQVGDHLLQMVAARLQICVRKGDSLARLGGDEFVLILPGLVDDHAAAAVAAKILEELKTAFYVGGHELHVGGSIGISLYPTDGEDADTLMRAADTAMYHAKAKGRGNYQFFTQSLNTAAQHRLIIANQLRQALVRSEFSLHFQPQVDIVNGKMFSAEALLRWRQPERGFIPPNEFISIAEETGLILPIGEWVLRAACAELRRWRDAGHADMCIAVNLSARQLLQPGFAGIVAAILDEAGLPPEALDLEITESILMHPSEDNLGPLTQLSDMGVQLSVDDFGTGYSSLSYLKRFPIDALKIDQSFVRGIGQEMNDAAITNAIIAMAHSLNLKVIAEGVETAEQAAFLRAHHCMLAQGYYYSRPVPAEVFVELLRRQPLLSPA